MRTIKIVQNHQVIDSLYARPPIIWHGLIFPRLVGIHHRPQDKEHPFLPIFAAPIAITKQANELRGCDIYISFFRKLMPWFAILLSPYPPFVAIVDCSEAGVVMVTKR